MFEMSEKQIEMSEKQIVTRNMAKETAKSWEIEQEEDLTMEDIDAEIEKLTKEEEYLQKLDKLKHLRKRVHSLKEKSANGTEMSENKSLTQGMASLHRRAEAFLSNKNLRDNSSTSDTDNTTTTVSSDDISQTEDRRATHRKRAAQNRKGRNEPPTNLHLLRYQYHSKNIKYEDLDLALFMACELDSVKKKLSKTSNSSSKLLHKLEHLIKIAYHSKQYDWQAILDFHVAVSNEVKEGRTTWGDNFVHIEATTLHPHPRPAGGKDIMPVSQRQPIRRPLYCFEYQEGKCMKPSTHQGTFGEGMVSLHHFCRSCFVKEGVQRYHQPLSGDCPYGPLDYPGRYPRQ